MLLGFNQTLSMYAMTVSVSTYQTTFENENTPVSEQSKHFGLKLIFAKGMIF